MKAFNILARSCVERMMRKLYTLWLLNRASIGRNVRIHFPIQMQGRGRTFFGDGMTVHRNVTIACAAGSELQFGKKCLIAEAAFICSGLAGKIIFEDDCSIGPFVQLISNSRCNIGEGTHIASYCSIFAREKGLHGTLKVGRRSHIGDNTLVDLSGSVIIGNDVAVGPYSIVYTHDHDHRNSTPVAWAGGVICRPVEIGDGAWVGARVTILSGVTIGSRAVVAAGAVVTKDVPPGAVVGGVPAKILASSS
jgi:acetyltransferase-like isoleucine patch superfamily enzyme